ncbi:hypothetical protein OG214_37850 [Streptomyces sp. NBC_00872]|nr:hypothetical protein OG214_37850 [Streptomyces sp. NBC_00872]
MDATLVQEGTALVDEDVLAEVDAQPVVGVEGRIDGDGVGNLLADDLGQQGRAGDLVVEGQDVEV